MPDDRFSISGAAGRRVLVTGATGRFGGIADLLIERGHQVRAATRDPAHPVAARLAVRGAEVIRADFEDIAALAAAARGVDAVFASGTAHRAGPDGETRHGRNLAAALARAGAPYLVFVSGAGADRAAGLPLMDAKRAVEARIRELRIPAAVIAPVYLMENLFNPWNLAAIGAGMLPTPVPPSQRLQQVATADVLALSARVIERPAEFAGERIEVAAEELTGQEAASVLSAQLGRGFTAVQLPRAGLPPGVAALFRWLERDPPTADIGALRSRFPDIGWRGFGDWAREQRARLSAGARAC